MAIKKFRPEEAFLQQVLALAKLRGWRRAHFRPSRTVRGWRTAVQADGKGFPDLFLVRPRTRSSVLVAELLGREIWAGKYTTKRIDGKVRRANTQPPAELSALRILCQREIATFPHSILLYPPPLQQAYA